MDYLEPTSKLTSHKALIEELVVLKNLIKEYEPSEDEEGIWEELDIRITWLEGRLLGALTSVNNTDLIITQKLINEDNNKRTKD